MRRIVAMSFLAVLIASGCSSDKRSSDTSPSDTSSAPGSTAGANTNDDTNDTINASTNSNTVATTAAPADSGSVTIATAPSGPGLGINPCGIVTAADVAAVFGGTVADGAVDADNGGCSYDITGTTNTGPVEIVANINISYGQSDYISTAEEQKVFPDIVPIDGVGDEAWYFDAAHQLHVSVNGTELLISGLLPGDAAATQAEVVAFGKVVVGKLG